MSAKDQPDNAPLILNELKIPGRTGPVSETPKVWGINRAAALDNFPRQGLLCQAGPWAPMNRLDKLVIYKDKTQEILPKTVDENEVGTELQMFVEARHITEGTYTLSYSVTRQGGTAEHSLEMQVLVKLTRPGGEDHSEEPGHPDLVMTIPEEILKGGIDEDNVAAGVLITIGNADGEPPYPFAAAGDVIRVSWGGVFVLSAPLTQAQADGTDSITVKIEEGKIRKAGDSDDSGLAVVFEVYDLVDNRSSDWSVEQRVLVAVDTTRLVAPLLKEALNNVLDVDKLGDADGTAQVWVLGSSFKVGDIPILTIKGTPQEGPPVDIEVLGEALVSVPTTHETKIANSLLRQLAKSQIALSYRLKKADGSADLRAKTQFIRAIGEVQRLAAPIMLDEDSGALDPTLAQIRLEIPFDKSFAEGQVLQPIMLGTTPGLKPYLPVLPARLITRNDIIAEAPLAYSIDGKHLAPVNGGTAEFYYQQLIADAVLATLDKYAATRAIRESIHTDILQVGEPRLELPEPVVAGVVDGVLPADTAGTTLTVPYTETVKGDEVFMFWIGSITGEYPDSIKLNEFTAGKQVPFTIPAEEIKGNEGGTVIARYEIKRADGRTSYAEPLEFSVGVALENPLPLPQMPEATGNGASVTLAPLDAQAGARVIVAYTGMNETHNIKLSMLGTPGVGSPEIPAKPGVASGSVEFLIPATAIAANIGNETKTFTLSYEVTAGQTTPSLPLTVSVTPLPATELDKISIEQAEGTVLDLAKVTLGATILAGVWAFIAANHRVGLNFKGTKSNGDAFHHVVWPWPSSYVNQNWFNSGQYTHTLAYNAIKDLADGSRLELYFKAALTLSREEAEAIDAPVKTYKIKALPTPLKPSIKEAAGSNSLDPIAAKNSLTVVVPHYAGMDGTDQISVTWTGADGTPAGGSHTSTAVPVGTVGIKEIPIPNSVVAFNLGKAVVVFYTVIRNGASTKSGEFVLNVQAIPEEDAELPTPTIDRAPDEELDLTDLADDARTRIAKWPLIAVGQKVWLRYSGIDEDDNPYERLFYDGVTVEFGDLNGLLPLAPVEELRTLKGGSELRIEFKISYDSSTNENQAVTAPIRRYTIMATPKLCIDTTPLILDGTNVVLTDPQNRWSRTADSIGTIERRAACGGTPPYTYESEDPTIASVDDRGVVRSTGNGETIISVKDSMNVVISFEVRTSNVYELAITAQTFPTSMAATAGISAVGGTMIDYKNAAEIIKIITALSHAYYPLQLPYASNIIERFYTGNLINDGYPKQFWEVTVGSFLSTRPEQWGPGFVYQGYWMHVNGSSGGGTWPALRAIYLM
ncbi:hypothetical protein [Pseudomonas sp. P108]|uniref:hypothetical protein n=1 Tax=Pseudomonas sp. P108 TaxID=1837993 RepID=UPI0029347C3B|nr:hypothetical protein [Pseudomonas sp. P108]WNZ81750.1 hypothetical protein QOM10_15715 [Pseudomonas sp. P108]